MASSPGSVEEDQNISPELKRFLGVITTRVMTFSGNVDTNTFNITANVHDYLRTNVYPTFTTHPVLTDLSESNKLDRLSFCANGMFKWTRHWTRDSLSWTHALAKYYMVIFRDFPDVFPPQCDDHFMSYLQARYLLLTDWKGMIRTASSLSPDEDPCALALLIYKAVRRAIRHTGLTMGMSGEEHRQKITEAFVVQLPVVLKNVKKTAALFNYLHIVPHLHLATLNSPQYSEAFSSLVNQLRKIATTSTVSFLVARKSVEAIGHLSKTGNPICADALSTLQTFMILVVIITSRLAERVEPEVGASIMEKAIGLANAYSPTVIFPHDRSDRFYRIVHEVAADSSANPRKWSNLAHRHAIVLLYDKYWYTRVNMPTDTLDQVAFMSIAVNFLKSSNHSVNATLMVISLALDVMQNGDEAANSAFKLDLSRFVAEYFYLCFFIDNANVVQVIQNYHNLVTAFFEHSVKGLIPPEHSALLYRNLHLMNKASLEKFEALHGLCWRSCVYCPQLCVAMLAGLRVIYVGICNVTAFREPLFSSCVTDLAKKAQSISSWLVLPTTTSRNQWKVNGGLMAEEISRVVQDCGRRPETMGPFCEVLAPFIKKLLVLQRKPLKRQVLQIFSGRAIPGVKILVTALRMKRNE